MEQHHEQQCGSSELSSAHGLFFNQNYFSFCLYLVPPLGRVLGITFQLELSELNPSKGE